MKKFTGLVAAPFAPMDEHGNLRLDRIGPYFDLLEKNGVTGAFVNGSTGEGPSLSASERMRIAEHWAARAQEKRTIRIINLVGGTSYAECIEQARFSASAGIDAIAVVAPYYFKPANAAQLAGFVAKVAESVPEMPVYFYHIPVLSGCHVPMLAFLEAAGPLIPNLAGIKYTHEDFMDFLSCLRFMDGRFDMLWGRDENMLAALALGSRGAVGSTYNYAAPLYDRLISAFDAGDLDTARRLQMDSIRMITLLGRYGGIATGKAYMRFIGFDCGGFRSPVRNLSRDEYLKFSADAEALGIQHLFSVL